MTKVCLSFDLTANDLGDLIVLLMDNGFAFDLQPKPSSKTGSVREMAIPRQQMATPRQQMATPRQPSRQKARDFKKPKPSTNEKSRHLVRFSLGNIVPLNVPAGKVILRNTRLVERNDLENARTLSDVRPSQDFDTLLVPGGKDAVEKAFENGHEWGFVALSEKKVQNVKYVAVYEAKGFGRNQGRGIVVGIAPVLDYVTK